MLSKNRYIYFVCLALILFIRVIEILLQKANDIPNNGEKYVYANLIRMIEKKGIIASLLT